MTFTPNMPIAGQSLGVTQPLVNANFASLRSTISNGTQPNHIDVNATGAGKHIFVQMPVQSPDSANLPAANEGGLITQTVGSSTELFYIRDDVNIYYQVTGPCLKATDGYAPLMGGNIIQWGTATFPIGTSQSITVTLPLTLSAPPYSVVTSLNSATGGTSIIILITSNILSNQFTISTLNGTGSSAPFSIGWMAIGPQ